MTRLLPVALSVALVFPLAVAGDAAVDPREHVRQAALVTYVHGMTDEIASAEVGEEGVPYLLELLEDRDFPRRDNVVAFLAHLAGEDAVAPLTRCLENPPARSLGLPQEDRAMLLIPQALGHIAARGSPLALQRLLELTDPSSTTGPVVQDGTRSVYPPGLHDDLVRQALWGLALSGTAEAETRLTLLQAVEPAPGRRDQREAAREALARMHSGSLAARFVESAKAVDLGTAGLPRAVDTQTQGDEHLLTFANHVGVPSKMSELRLDTLLSDASSQASFADFVEDVACCMRVSRGSEARSFGTPGDGRDVIDSSFRVNQVLQDPVARVKVVRLISYCGGPGTNIVGCAAAPGNGMLLVRITINEGVLWLHEYGHNVGLGHNPDSRYIMHGRLSTGARALDQPECDRFHTPSGATGALMQDLGVCHDDDGDGIVSTGDNCPDVDNPSQADADSDGLGDPCDPCHDVDGDGYGMNGSASCPGGAAADCDDTNPDAYPGFPDICDGVDNDCDGQSDESLCSDFDVSGDLLVSGEDLSWLGRAFGLCSADPSAEWWGGIDFNLDGCVDGKDLSVMGAVWGCAGGVSICDAQ